jgi:hypothetical protein
MEIMGIGSVAAISIICFIFGLAWKTSPLPDKWIPLLCGVIGGGLGVPAMIVMAEFPAADPITAVAVGIVSGLAATGVHQIYKQLTSKEGK